MTQDNAASPALPRLRLDFYDSAVLLTRFEDGGISVYPVAPHDVAQACADVELSTGLLPVNTLFWKRQGNTTTLAVYVPARRWQVQLAGDERYHLPLPPFIFIGQGAAYYAYAVKRRPWKAATRLWQCPAPTSTATAPSAPATPLFRPARLRPLNRRCAFFGKAATSTATWRPASAGLTPTMCASCGGSWTARPASPGNSLCRLVPACKQSFGEPVLSFVVQYFQVT